MPSFVVPELGSVAKGPRRGDESRDVGWALAVRVLRFAFVWVALGCAACTRVPTGMAAVDAVSVQGNRALSSGDVEEKLATTPTPKFLGVFRGVMYDYQLFDQGVLQKDIERVERYYRARGFYEAIVRAGRIHYVSANHVQVTIEVAEGPPVLIRSFTIEGIDALSPKEAKAARSAMSDRLKKGKRFEEARYEEAEDAIKRALTDRGYAWAQVKRRADVDLPGHYADLFFEVTPGPKATFGSIRIEGLGELPEPPVRRAMDIAPGERYSTETIEEAKRAILDLGTFTSVEITPDLPEPPPPAAVVSLLVRVHPQKLKSVLLGGGFQLDAIRTELHLHVGWEHQNLFGGFRHFMVDLKPGFDLYPTRLPNFPKPTAFLPEERLRATLRQPGFLEARTHGVTSHEVNTYAVLLTTTVDPKAPVIGYWEYKGSAGVDRTFGRLFGAPGYNFQINRPFAYKGHLDPDLRGVVVSYVDLLTHLDWRDDRVEPHEGLYLQTDLQFAGLGGDARDVRIEPELRGYVPIAKKVTLAARATVGLLFPMNYGDAAQAARSGEPPADRAAWNQDLELIFLRGFFSGGPSSNRGYPFRGIGPRGPAPFYNPGLEAQALARSCDLGNPDYDAARCGIALGGLSLWEASLELRYPIHGPMTGAVFCDASDVSPDRANLRLNYPHLSCGVGFRYATPIGPVRLDLGYRIPGAQVPKGVDPRLDSDPSTIYGVPIAIAFGIGEAF